MTKNEFLTEFKSALKEKNIPDAEDILSEYEQHFNFKLADGFSEEEISARLGSPMALAAQFEADAPKTKSGKKALTVTGLCVTDLFFGIFYILLWAWEIVMAALTLSFAAAAAALFTNIRESFVVYVPEMPYRCAFILGFALLALTVLTAIGTVYFGSFTNGIMRSFSRFHKNVLAAASGKAVLPSVSPYPQFSAKTKRLFRKITLVSVIVFAIFFIAGFAACVISAKTFEFWHVWEWFLYL